MSSTNVIDLTREREDRAAAARHARMHAHPSMRWIAGGAYWVAHRRADGAPVCGAPGELVLAATSVPLCTDCFPDARTTEVV